MNYQECNRVMIYGGDPPFRSIWQKEKYFGRKFGSTYLYLRGSDSIFNLLEVFLAGSNLIGGQEPLKDLKNV